MFAEMNVQTVISTDLITPLGAYLRLRGGDRAGFLLESVERGRLGRHSFVGSGSRFVDFAEAEALRRAGRRLPRLRPRGDARAHGRAAGRRPRPAREPLRRRRHADPVRPRAWPRGGPRAATRTRSRRCSKRRSTTRRTAAARKGGPHAAPRPVRVRARRRAGEAPHPRRRRVPDRPLAARRAADAGLCRRPLPLAPARQSVAVPLPARSWTSSRWSAPRRRRWSRPTTGSPS